MLTFTLICISILNLTNQPITFIEKTEMDTLMLIISIFLFALSIYFPSLSNRVKQLHENATNINGLLRTLKLAKSPKDLEKISESYAKYELQLNHDTIDYNRWCDTINSSRYNHGFFKKTYYLFLWHFYANFIYLTAISIAIIFS